jgi:hypothetical protein
MSVILLLHKLRRLRKLKQQSSFTCSWSMLPERSSSYKFLKREISLIFEAFRLTNLKVINFCGFFTSDSFYTGAAGKVEVEELKLLPLDPEPAEPNPKTPFMLPFFSRGLTLVLL